MLGDTQVGKTSILSRFIENKFTHNYITTLGIDFLQKTISVDGMNLKIQAWDTCGQEKYRTLAQAYYKSAMGIILVYDVSKEETLERCRDWLRQIEVHAEKDVKIILVGNKADLSDDERCITFEQGQAFAREFAVPFFETSAMSGDNVTEAF